MEPSPPRWFLAEISYQRTQRGFAGGLDDRRSQTRVMPKIAQPCGEGRGSDKMPCVESTLDYTR